MLFQLMILNARELKINYKSLLQRNILRRIECIEFQRTISRRIEYIDDDVHIQLLPETQSITYYLFALVESIQFNYNF